MSDLNSPDVIVGTKTSTFVSSGVGVGVNVGRSVSDIGGIGVMEGVFVTTSVILDVDGMVFGTSLVIGTSIVFDVSGDVVCSEAEEQEIIKDKSSIKVIQSAIIL